MAPTRTRVQNGKSNLATSFSPSSPYAPFKINIVQRLHRPSNTPNHTIDESVALPASWRTRRSKDSVGDDIVLPFETLPDFLKREILIPQLDRAKDWLWVCGRPMPPRSLHHQILLKRSIAVTEDPNLHMVWSKGRIFLKPLPAWLLSPPFWTKHIGTSPELEECARGFLYSYCALVAYPSDFRLALDAGLLPEGLAWADWKRLVTEVLPQHHAADVHKRYWYGELRLGRLNKVYVLHLGAVLRRFSSVDSPASYGDLLRNNFALLATALAYVVVVLTAMQVGLAVDDLKVESSFQKASYYFTIIAIVAPLAGAFLILAFFLARFCGNWYMTREFKKERYKHMMVGEYAASQA